LGFAWLIIMGSKLDDWIYWHFFTITINYNSSQSMTVYCSLHSLLNYECLLFHSDEWRTKNSFRLNWTHLRTNSNSALTLLSVLTCPPFYNFGELNRDHHLEQFVVIMSVVTGTCLPNRCLANGLVRCYSLQRERDYRTVDQQWTSALSLLFRFSGGVHQTVA
jgi:hypothetical protein